MSYQAVVRNANNLLVINQNVSTRVSILQGSAAGSVVYVGQVTYLWLANADGTVNRWPYRIYYNALAFSAGGASESETKARGFSVRSVRD